MPSTLHTIITAAPVIPVLIVEGPDDAVPLARALVAGGLPAIEITLRTPGAGDAIRALKSDVPGAFVGAGTVLTPAQVEQVETMGCDFAVTPGISPALLAAIDGSSVPYLPGCATASEALSLAERGYRMVKFFPAEPAGGVAYLKALASPLSGIGFCPTGGINAANAGAYLALPNVVCVGGSWVAPAAQVAAGNWQAITALARDAARMA